MSVMPVELTSYAQNTHRNTRERVHSHAACTTGARAEAAHSTRLAAVFACRAAAAFARGSVLFYGLPALGAQRSALPPRDTRTHVGSASARLRTDALLIGVRKTRAGLQHGIPYTFFESAVAARARRGRANTTHGFDWTTGTSSRRAAELPDESVTTQTACGVQVATALRTPPFFLAALLDVTNAPSISPGDALTGLVHDPSG